MPADSQDREKQYNLQYVHVLLNVKVKSDIVSDSISVLGHSYCKMKYKGSIIFGSEYIFNN